MALAIGLIADDAAAQVVKGTATYRERMLLPAGAVFEAAIEDVSRADARAVVMAATCIESPGVPPIAFTIAYDKARIVESARYVVRAKILLDGKLLFTTDTAHPVITGGNPSDVSILLLRVGGEPGPGTRVPPTPPETPSPESLVGIYWKAVELAGMKVPALTANREPHLVLGADGRFSGADGCNRLAGSYTLKDNGITFGQAAGTLMACPDTAEVERRFRSALKGTSHWSLVQGQLLLSGATGKPLAVFDRGALPSTPSGPAPLQGTSWQLVRFQGGDDRVLTPDDPAKYTIEFAADGRLSARIDCNRGAGSWKATASNELELGPLALTRAMCPPGSLHDHIVKQWGYIRSFLVKDGHLFLVLMADGGTFEFEPRAAKQ